MADYTLTKTRPTAVSLIRHLDSANHWISRWLGTAGGDIAQIVAHPTAADPSRKMADATRVNSRGLGLLRQFERMPSYTEQTLREVERAVLRQVKVPLTSNQFSALVSLTYSVGEASLKRSTLLKYLNAGHYEAAANEFDRWVYVGANPLPKLVARRLAEKKLFLKIER